MPPTPQAVQIAGQKQNQQQYDPSKGPPVQNAASLHTPPPQLPGRLPQGALPMPGLPIALSQQPQLVESTAQPAAQLQAQMKVQAGGTVMAAGVNPHTQLQAQLQQQMQPGLHLQLQQQQPQAMLQPGQAVSASPDISKSTSHSACPHTHVPLSSPQTVALSRPAADTNQPVQRILTNSVSVTPASSAPLSAPSAAPSAHTAQPLRPLGSGLNPGSQSKLTGTNGISAVKVGGFGQSANTQPSQEGSQDKQVEQAKLVGVVLSRAAAISHNQLF